jgi:DNA-binding response OmpR family regulator
MGRNSSARGFDAIGKPFAYPELRARIAALLRRTKQRPASRIRRVGPVTIDVAGREVRVNDQPVELSAKEYELLLALSGDPTRVLTNVYFGLLKIPPGRERTE